MGFEAIIAAGSGMVWQISLPIASVVLPPHQRTDAVALLNMAQLGGIAIALAVSGAIYENVGFQNVDEVVSGSGLSEHDIRELLSGAASPVSTTVAPKMLAQIVDAVTIAIVDCFYLTIAASGICFTAACLMRFEALEFKRPKPKSED